MAAIEAISISPESLSPWRVATLAKAIDTERSDDLALTTSDGIKIVAGVVVAGLLATTPVTGPTLVKQPAVSRAISWYTAAYNFLNPAVKEPASATKPLAPETPAAEQPEAQESGPAENINPSIDPISESTGTGGPVLLEPAQMVEAARPDGVVIAQPPAVIIIPTAIPTPRVLSLRDLPVQPAYSPILTESDWKAFFDSVGFYADVEGINRAFLWELFKCENRGGKRMDGLDIVEREGTRNGTVQIGMGQITPSISLYVASGMTIPEQRRSFSPDKLEELYVREAHYLADPTYAAKQAAILIRKLDPYQQFPDCTRKAVALVGSIYAP